MINFMPALTPEKNPSTHRIGGPVHTFSKKEILDCLILEDGPNTLS
jgi:hypothetical protein